MSIFHIILVLWNLFFFKLLLFCILEKKYSKFFILLLITLLREILWILWVYWTVLNDWSSMSIHKSIWHSRICNSWNSATHLESSCSKFECTNIIKLQYYRALSKHLRKENSKVKLRNACVLQGMVTRSQCRRLGVRCPHGGIHLEDMRRSRLTHAKHEGHSFGEEDALELDSLTAQHYAASSQQQENSGTSRRRLDLIHWSVITHSLFLSLSLSHSLSYRTHCSVTQ